jgi:hypothetical protein
VIRIVPDLGFEDDDVERLRRDITEVLPRGVSVKVVCVPSIPVNSSGKFSFAVSEVDRSDIPGVDRPDPD